MTAQVLTKAPAVPQIPYQAPAALQVPKKEYPFHEPIIYPPSWKLEMADIDRNYAFLQTTGQKETSLEKLAKDTTKPIIFIGKPIYEGVMEMAKYASDKYNSEVAAYFMYTQMNQYSPHWEVFGWFMTGQTASGAEVEMEGSDLPRYLGWLKTNHPELWLRMSIGHAHSHVMMSTFWSGVDTKQQYDKSQLAPMTGNRLFLVANAKREIKGKYIQYTPVQVEIDDISIGISFNHPDYLKFDIKDQREKIHTMVDSLLEVRKYTASTHIHNAYQFAGFKSDLEEAELTDAKRARRVYTDDEGDFASWKYKRKSTAPVKDEWEDHWKQWGEVADIGVEVEGNTTMVENMVNFLESLSVLPSEDPFLEHMYTSDPTGYPLRLNRLIEWIADSLTVLARPWINTDMLVRRALLSANEQTIAHDVLEVFTGEEKGAHDNITRLYCLLLEILSLKDAAGDSVWGDVYFVDENIDQDFLNAHINDISVNLLHLVAMVDFVAPVYTQEGTDIMASLEVVIDEAFNNGHVFINWDPSTIEEIGILVNTEDAKARKEMIMQGIDDFLQMVIAI